MSIGVSFVHCKDSLDAVGDKQFLWFDSLAGQVVDDSELLDIARTFCVGLFGSTSTQLSSR